MKNEVHHCPVNGKFIYTSEAKATRAMNRYTDIRRMYFCYDCKGWHTTKMGIGLAIQTNTIKPPSKKDITMEKIKKRLAKLTGKKKDK